MNIFKFWAGLLLCLFALQSPAAPLSLLVRGHAVQHDLFSVFAHPGEEIRLELLSGDTPDLQLELDGGGYGRREDGAWLVTAPRNPGLYRLRLTSPENGTAMDLNLFVGIPDSAVSDGRLNGYLIGPPPPSHSKYPAFYTRPQVFFEVTAANIDTRLSPNFTLRQFLCKQESGFPKYVVLKESLLVLLEGLVEEVRQAGYPVETFGVISGYRTPWYNKRIGNVPNSRHVYGDSMDFFIDLDGDGNLDDLNGDGQRNRPDVDLLYEIVQKFKLKSQNGLLVGGVGRYYRAPHHGGFVHVDARGFRARW